jgi:hypothetical protein
MATYIINNEDWNVQEKVQTRLTAPLKAGRDYCVRFYISLAEESRYSCSTVGAYFSKESLAEYPFYENNLYHHILNASGNYPEYDKWKKVEGSYTAQGGEEYLILGRFDVYGMAEVILVDSVSEDFELFYGNGCYIYLDSVYVGLCDAKEAEVSVPNIITPNGDGVNDLFTVQAEHISEFSLLLYNRWGACVLVMDNPAGADLKHLSDGVYFWTARFTDLFGDTFFRSGALTIVR